MNRRKFISSLSFAALTAACSKPTNMDSLTLQPEKVDNYLRDVSAQVYPKVKDMRIPIDMEIVRFNPAVGRFERTVAKRVFLHPTLKPDGILAWSPEEGSTDDCSG